MEAILKIVLAFGVGFIGDINTGGPPYRAASITPNNH
jgi:hypothetical protein